MARLYILGAIAVFAFQLYCLLDAITAEPMTIRNLPKMVWVLLVLLFPLLGGLAWMLAGRPKDATLRPGGRRSAQRRRPSTGNRLPSAPRGPDDDPDFLRRLDRRRFDEDDERT